MKQDYLWDKKGNDPDIEILETALSAYRYAETAPPVLPMPEIKLIKRRFWNFQFLIPVTAAAAALLAFGLWFGQTGPKDVSEVATPVLTGPPETAKVQSATYPAQESVAAERPIAVRYTAKRRPETTPAPRMIKKGVVLTKEEKFAYDQLMLALSITGSKLRLVKDAANSVETPNPNSPETLNRIEK